jgi:hypothetical protein
MEKQYKVERKFGRFYVNGKVVKKLKGFSGGWRFKGLTADGLVFKADGVRTTIDRDEELEVQTAREISLYAQFTKRDVGYFPKLIASGTYEKGGKEHAWLLQEKLEINEYVKCTERHEILANRLESRYGINDLQGLSDEAEPYDGANWYITPRGKLMIYDFGY